MEKKISIVIPVYNTEEYLAKCLDSVLGQTYKNIEVIVVDDCSPDNSEQIIKSYAERDDRVVYVKNSTNLGLFHARLAGADVATGDYIAFLDSDDYVSLDIYRLAIEKSNEINADIVMFKFVRFNEDNRYYIQNLIDFNLYDMSGDEFRKLFFEQEALYYNYHTIWNKIYSKELWDKCRNEFDSIQNHLIMTEDVAYSTVLVSNCENFGFVGEYGLYYLVREGASTTGNNNYNKIKKNINDIVQAFNFAQNYVDFNPKVEKYSHNFHAFKERYYRMWYELIDVVLNGKEKEECMSIIQDGLNIYDHAYKAPEDFASLEVETDLDPRWEQLKQQIISPNIEVVSFDIFDTLIVRPFLEPADLYYFLDIYYSELTRESQMFDFSHIRVKAERYARENSEHEDINIEEIYEVIVSKYNFSYKIANKMLEKEKELEIKYCYKRESLYQLYKMAKYLGKKVVIVSDMYLGRETIESILNKNGYTDYDGLYISSETRKLKYTTSMFKHVIKDLSVNPKNVIHIGDNWNADKVAADKTGITGVFIPKVANYIKNDLQDKLTGNIMYHLSENLGTGTRVYNGDRDMFTRCMIAIAGNIIYDNPYVTVHPNSDYNGKPEFIGTMAFGPHLLSLTKWIIEDSIDSKYDKVHFLARDGYMPLKAYEILSRYYDYAPKSNYIFASRRSIIPYLFNNNLNKYSILEMVSLEQQNRNKIIEIVKPILIDNFDEVFDKEKYDMDQIFVDENEFINFIELIGDEYISQDKLSSYNKSIAEYFRQISDNDVTFDLGYSGRIQTAICDILGTGIDTYYLHKDLTKSNKYMVRGNFKIKPFYDYKPAISGACLEYFYASNEYSCIGYEREENGIDVLFDEKGIERHRQNIDLLHRSTIEFIEKFTNVFKNDIKYFVHSNVASSLMFEQFLSHPKEIDRAFAKVCFSEDFVHAGSKKMSIYGNWDYELGNLYRGMNVQQSASTEYVVNGKFKKAIFYYITDKNEFNLKAKKYLKKKTKFLKFK